MKDQHTGKNVDLTHTSDLLVRLKGQLFVELYNKHIFIGLRTENSW